MTRAERECEGPHHREHDDHQSLPVHAGPSDPAYGHHHTYDLAGNRTEVWENGAPVANLSYNDANQVIGWSYDAAGNLLSDGTSSRSYDALSRLVAQAGTSYTYNGDGVLVSDGTTTYAQDLAAPLSQVLSDGTANYVYGHARLRALGGPWYVGDALGSVRQTLDDAGGVLATTNYDPWGTPQGTLSAPFGFTGELHSAEQVYLRARWYTPGQGRFVSEDPFAGFAEMPYSLHAYQYAYSNPVVWTDPSGQCTDLGFGSSIYCEPGEEPLTPAEAEALCGPKPPSHPRTGPTYICNPQRGAWEPLLKTGTIVVGGLPSLGRALPGLGKLPQIGKAGVEACTNLLGGLLVLATSQSDTKTKTRTRRRDQDTIRYFYHGTDTESAMSIVSGGIQPGFTRNKALGDGFYTFVYEDAAEQWAFGRVGPAVVRIGMPESTFKDLKKKKLVREAPWVAYPGAPPEPGLDQVLFKPGAYLTLNSPPAMREWKSFQGNSWTAYTATT